MAQLLVCTALQLQPLLYRKSVDPVAEHKQTTKFTGQVQDHQKDVAEVFVENV